MDLFDLQALLDNPEQLKRRVVLAMALEPRKQLLARPHAPKQVAKPVAESSPDSSGIPEPKR